jgi:SAM-dependent methyltransferase
MVNNADPGIQAITDADVPRSTEYGHEADRLPARFDPGVPHPARVYCYWLGGKDHFPADREVAREVVRLRPEVLAGVKANRAFGRRVTGYAAAGLGIRQFLDIGAGLPAPDPTHETAQKISPACRVVYADNDPLVLAHARALMIPVGGADPCACIHGDVRDPAGLLAAAGAVLDFTRPVAVLLLAVLHFLADADDPAGVVAQFAAALAPGSLIAISHLTADYAPQAIAGGAAAYNAQVPCPVYPRTRDQVAGWCGDLPVQYPGVVPVNFWRPSLREPASPALDLHGAVIGLPMPAAPPRVLRAAPSPQEQAAELERRAAQYPGHDLTREDTGNGTRYVARARDLNTHPSLVMTSTLDELCARLTPALQPAAH